MNTIAQTTPNILDIEVEEINQLLEQHWLLRVLQPKLRHQIEESVENSPNLAGYVREYDGEMYLSLEAISNPQKREQVYDLIQCYQIDESVSLQKAPAGLRACLERGRNKHGRFIGAVAVGAILGCVIGLMGMALGVLLLSVTGLRDEVVGLRITAVMFVTFCALGWVAGTYYLWRVRPWVR